ncbi:MAG: DUF6090 family protein, partial [Bacteroidota bacterium]
MPLLFKKIRIDAMLKSKISKYLLYALGEIILVVIGILIALQINTWNENTKNRKKERSFLTSIHKEFVANQAQLDTVMYYHRRALHSTGTLIEMFPLDLKNDNLDTISKHLYNSLYTHTYNPSEGSVQSIVNTSSLDLIQDEELRNLIMSWKGVLVDFQEGELSSKRIVTEKIDDFLASHIDFDLNLSNPRNNLEALESLKFEYFMKLRLSTLQ